MLKEPRPSSRSPWIPARTSEPRTPVRRDPAGAQVSAEEILHLQRTIGNRAVGLAIQRLSLLKGKDRAKTPGEDETVPASATPARPAEEPADKPKRWLEDSEGAGRVGEGLSQAGTVVGLDAAALKEANVAGASTDLGPVGGVAGAFADIADLAAARRERKDAIKAAADAEDSGSAFSQRATGRKVGIETANVATGYGKVGADAAKSAGSVVSVAKNYGDLGAQAANTGSLVTGAVALPVTTLNAARDTWKLVKQGFRLRRLNKLLTEPGASQEDIRAVQQLERDHHQALLETQEIILEGATRVGQLETGLSDYPGMREQAVAEARAAGPDRRRELVALIREGDRLLTETLSEIAQLKLKLEKQRADVRRSQDEERKAAEAYRIMTAEVTSAAEDARRLEQGEKPSLKAIATYAKLKSVSGVVRKTFKVLSGQLGVASAIVGVVAVAGVTVAGPVGLALAASAAVLGLTLASYAAWRFLSKRWDRTQDAFIEAKDEKGNKTYKKIETFSERAKATLSFRTKLYHDDKGEKEKKSHRKLMAEALWDYATSDEYPRPLQQEAWKLITELTGKAAAEVLKDDPGRSAEENKQARDAEKKAALKLFEDKLKSA